MKKGRRIISKEEGQLYWDLIDRGKTHIEAYTISESAFSVIEKEPNYSLKIK